MPQGDKRGPEGKGSVTGRGLGYCTGNDTAGFTTSRSANRGNGMGWRRRTGSQSMNQGYRMKRGTHIEPIEVREETLIKNEINILKDRLVFLEKRLSELSDTISE